MKKRASLFLALLMVFSVLFATSAEAARIKPTVDEQTQNSASAVTVREEVEAPRVTDPDQPGDSAMGAVTPGGGTTPPCSHKYRTDPYSTSKHKRTCTKCGYSYYASHSYGYVVLNGTYHNKVCNLCGYIAGRIAHSFSYEYHGTYHIKKCSTCGYNVKQYHARSTEWDDIYHKVECSQCGVHWEKHNYDDEGVFCLNCGYAHW